MRPLDLIRLVALVTLIASLPVIGAIAVYAQEAPGITYRTSAHRLLNDPNLNGPAPMPGQNVVTTDGQRIGEVVGVSSSPGGHVKAMLFKTGGFWGFGARTVVVPAGRFAVTGQDVYINFNKTDVELLPDVQGGQG